MSASQEVNGAVGARDEADAEIEQLQAELHQPSVQEQKAQRLAALEAQKRARRMAQLKAVAGQRLLGIQRAIGSLVDLEHKDERKLVAAAQAYAEMIVTLNERTDKHVRLTREAQLLAAAFELALPELPDPQVPARRDVASESVRLVSEAELVGTLYFNAAPDHAELGDLPGRDLLREKAALEPPPPVPVRPTPTLSPEDADLLVDEAARSAHRRNMA